MSGCFFLIEKKEKVLKRFLILALTAVAYAAGSLIPFEPSKDADGCYVISTANELYALMDLQGRLLQWGCANGLTVMLLVAKSGRYLLRVAGRNRIVNVR